MRGDGTTAVEEARSDLRMQDSVYTGYETRMFRC